MTAAMTPRTTSAAIPTLLSPSFLSPCPNYNLRGRLCRGRAAALRPAEREREHEAHGGKGDGADRKRARLHAERAQGGDEPAARRVGAAHGDDVDHVLRLVFLIAGEHRE